MSSYLRQHNSLSPLLCLFFSLLYSLTYGQIQGKYFYDQEQKDLGTVSTTVITGTDIIMGGATWMKSGRQITLTKINESGIVQWVTEVPDSGPIAKITDGNNGFIYGVTTAINGSYPSYLFKVDIANGVLVWSKSIIVSSGNFQLQDYTSDLLLFVYSSSYDGSKYTRQLGFISKSDGNLTTRLIGKAAWASANTALGSDTQGNIYFTLHDTIYSLTGSEPRTLRWKRQHPNTAVQFNNLHIDLNNKLFAIGANESNKGKVLGIDPSNGDLLSNITTPESDIISGSIASTNTHLFISWKPIYTPPRTAWLITKIDKSDGSISWHSSHNLYSGQLSTTYKNDGDFVNSLAVDTDGNVFATGVFDSYNDSEGKWGIIKLNGATGAYIYYKIIPGDQADPNRHKNSSGVSVFLLNNKLCVVGNIQTYLQDLSSRYQWNRSTPEYATLNPTDGTLLTQTYFYGNYEYPSQILGIERDGENMIILKQIGRSLLLGKYDNQQNTIWEKTITEDYSLHEGLLKRSPSGRIAVAAIQKNLNNYTNGPNEGYSYFFEADGTPIWRKPISIFSGQAFSTLSLADLYTNDNTNFIFLNKDGYLRLKKIDATTISNEANVDISIHSQGIPYIFSETATSIKVSGHKNGIGVRTITFNKNTLAATILPFTVYPAFELYAIYQINDDEFILTGRDNNFKSFITRCNLTLSQTVWTTFLNSSTIVQKIIRGDEPSVVALGTEGNYPSLHKLDIKNGALLGAYTHQLVGLKTIPTDVTINKQSNEIVFSAAYEYAGGVPGKYGVLVSVNLTTMSLNKQLLVKEEFSTDNTAKQVETTANGVTWMGGSKNIAGPHKAAFLFSGTLSNPALDVEEPVLIAISPTNSSIVKPSIPLVLNFNEPVTLVSGNLTIFSSGSNSQLAQFSISATNTVTNGSTVTITPPSTLPADNTIYLQIDEGTFKDAAGNAFAGIKDKSWSLTTDSKAPLSFVKTPNASTSKLTGALQMTFNENVKAGAGTIRIYKSPSNILVSTIDVAATNAVSVKDTKVTIQPPAALSPNSTYFVNISAGAFVDLAGNSYAGIFNTSWYFYTQSNDVTAPQLYYTTPLTVSPTGGLELNFSEDVKLNNGTIRYYDASTNALVSTIVVTRENCNSFSGSSSTVTSGQTLPGNKTLYIQVDEGLFVDLEGNRFAGVLDNSWIINTSAVLPSPLVSKVPASNALQVSPYVTLMMEFTDSMIPNFGNGSIHIYDYSTDELLISFKVSSDNSKSYSPRVYSFPPQPLPEGRHVYVIVETGAFTTLSVSPRINYEGIHDKQWHFTTMVIDDEAPTITSRLPAAGSSNILTNTNIGLTFSENITLSNGDLIVFNATNDAPILSLTLSASNTSITGSQANITLPHSLTEGSSFYIKLTNGTFRDLEGNAFTGIQDKSWSFTTAPPADIEAPVLNYQYPISGSTDPSANSTLQLTFSEEILLSNGSIVIYNAANDSPVLSLPLTSSNTTITGLQANIVLPSVLAEGTSFYIKINTNSFKDLTGNTFEGIQDKSWYFSTASPADIEAPQLKKKYPLNRSIDASINTPLQLAFSEKITLDNGSISIYDNNNSLIQSLPLTSSNTDVSDSVATITLPAPLMEGLYFYIKVANNSFKDLAGNTFEGIQDRSWSFTTAYSADIEAPRLKGKYPLNESVDVSVNTSLQLTFSEKIILYNGSLVIYNTNNDSLILSVLLTSINTSVADSMATITLPASLPEGTSFYIKVAGNCFKDIAGNVFAGIQDKSWSFTTVSQISPVRNAPVLISHLPTNGAVNVSTSTSISGEFSEEIVLGEGALRIYNASTNQQILSMVLQGSNTVITGNQITISLSTVLPENTSIYINIDSGSFNNLKGDAYAGLADKSWVFTTSEQLVPTDQTPPVITATTPKNESFETNPVKSVTIQFNENVLINSGKQLVAFEEDTNQELLQLSLQASNSVVNQNIVTILFPTDLPSNKKVYIQINAGAFTDEAGNDFAGILSKEWKFTTQKVVTAIENPDQKNDLRIIRDGNSIIIDPNNSGISLKTIIDVQGRKLDFERIGATLVLLKPSNIIIIEGIKNNSPTAWKLLIK